LWKRSRCRVQPPPANRCRMRFSGVRPHSPSKAKNDATAAGD
jgi:hypothetical protein